MNWSVDVRQIAKDDPDFAEFVKSVIFKKLLGEDSSAPAFAFLYAMYQDGKSPEEVVRLLRTMELTNNTEGLG